MARRRTDMTQVQRLEAAEKRRFAEKVIQLSCLKHFYCYFRNF
jgi:hypothetical protein